MGDLVSTFDSILLGIYVGYVGRLFSDGDVPVTKFTMYSLCVGFPTRAGIVSSSNVEASASSLLVSMCITYWFILLLLDKPFHSNDTLPHRLDDLAVHLFLPVESFFFYAFRRRAYSKCTSFKPLFLHSVIYPPLFLNATPYKFLRDSSTISPYFVCICVFLVCISFHVVSIRVFRVYLVSRRPKST